MSKLTEQQLEEKIKEHFSKLYKNNFTTATDEFYQLEDGRILQIMDMDEDENDEGKTEYNFSVMWYKSEADFEEGNDERGGGLTCISSEIFSEKLLSEKLEYIITIA